MERSTRRRAPKPAEPPAVASIRRRQNPRRRPSPRQRLLHRAPSAAPSRLRCKDRNRRSGCAASPAIASRCSCSRRRAATSAISSCAEQARQGAVRDVRDEAQQRGVVRGHVRQLRHASRGEVGGGVAAIVASVAWSRGSGRLRRCRRRSTERSGAELCCESGQQRLAHQAPDRSRALLRGLR